MESIPPVINLRPSGVNRGRRFLRYARPGEGARRPWRPPRYECLIGLNRRSPASGRPVKMTTTNLGLDQVADLQTAFDAPDCTCPSSVSAAVSPSGENAMPVVSFIADSVAPCRHAPKVNDGVSLYIHPPFSSWCPFHSGNVYVASVCPSGERPRGICFPMLLIFAVLSRSPFLAAGAYRRNLTAVILPLSVWPASVGMGAPATHGRSPFPKLWAAENITVDKRGRR